jgi:hypothetical protein
MVIVEFLWQQAIQKCRGFKTQTRKGKRGLKCRSATAITSMSLFEIWGRCLGEM